MNGFDQAIGFLVAGAAAVGADQRAAVLRRHADALAPANDSLPMHGCFRRLGDGWLLTWCGQAACIRHTAGMDIIRFLLDHPGTSYSAADLEALVRGHAVTISPAASLADRHERGDLLAQRKQLATWRDSLADGHEDLPKIEQAIAELDRQIRGGWSDEYEAARARLVGNTRHALRRIREHLPAMAAHLEANMAVGDTSQARTDIFASEHTLSPSL
jgi:hypothetical protein